MVSSQAPTTDVAPPAKRKTPDSSDLLAKSAKKSRSESSNVKARGKEERFGGLVIVRGPPTRPPLSQETSKPAAAPNNASVSHAAVNETLSPEAGPSIPRKPQSSLRNRREDRNVDEPGTGRGGEGSVEDDVRRMDTEADDLRDLSRARHASLTPAALKVNLQFPAASQSSSQASSSSRSRAGKSQSDLGTPTQRPPSKDSLMPIAERETPQIAKNRLMRDGHPSMSQGNSSLNGSSGHSRRRSSLGMRGKRTSATFEATGIITRPHNSVANAALYKHIDADLPDSQRLRQLFVWTASRAMDGSSKASSSTSSTKRTDPSLPALPATDASLLKEIQEEIIRQLADGKVDTSVYSPESNIDRSNLRENEQNVKNRAREKLFTEQIEERRKEDIAWAEVVQFYVSHKDNVLASSTHRRRPRTPSAQSKGKQRATSQEPDDQEPWENELPNAFRGPSGYNIAKEVLSTNADMLGRLDPRLNDIQYKEDHVHAMASSVHQVIRIASSDLDQRFALLSNSLTQRTLPPASSSTFNNPSAISSFVPVASLPSIQQRGPDPQDLLRAISLTDAERPRNQVGDAARRAAKDVQRINESQSQLDPNERKLTDVPPPTPRKPPGTPKRSSTPGASRRN